MKKLNKEYRVIINGKLSDNKDLRLGLEKKKLQYEINIRVSWEEGNITDLAKEAQPGERIIVIGGDGSINEAVKGLMESSKRNELAFVPMGTANDFAREVNIPLDLELALDFAFDGKTQAVDVLQVNDEYCLNALSIGQAARVTERTPGMIKDVVGKFAYSLTSLISFFDTKSPVIFRDGETENEYIFGYIMNSSSCGGGFNVAPEALVDDGLMDVLLIKKMDLYSIANVTYDLWQDNENDYIKRLSLNELYLEGKETLPLSLDGEVKYLSNKIFVKCLNKKLKVVMPASSPMLKSSQSRGQKVS